MPNAPRLAFAACLLLAACSTTRPLGPGEYPRTDAGAIDVRLVDAKGKAIAGRGVRAERAAAGYVLATSPLQAARTSDEAITTDGGEARLGPLVPGAYTVAATGTTPLVVKRATVEVGKIVAVTLSVPDGAYAAASPSPTPAASPTPATSPPPATSPSPTASPTPEAAPDQ